MFGDCHCRIRQKGSISVFGRVDPDSERSPDRPTGCVDRIAIRLNLPLQDLHAIVVLVDFVHANGRMNAVFGNLF